MFYHFFVPLKPVLLLPERSCGHFFFVSPLAEWVLEATEEKGACGVWAALPLGLNGKEKTQKERIRTLASYVWWRITQTFVFSTAKQKQTKFRRSNRRNWTGPQKNIHNKRTHTFGKCKGAFNRAEGLRRRICTYPLSFSFDLISKIKLMIAFCRLHKKKKRTSNLNNNTTAEGKGRTADATSSRCVNPSSPFLPQKTPSSPH